MFAESCKDVRRILQGCSPNPALNRPLNFTRAGLAQLVELGVCNLWVLSSSLRSGTKLDGYIVKKANKSVKLVSLTRLDCYQDHPPNKSRRKVKWI